MNWNGTLKSPETIYYDSRRCQNDRLENASNNSNGKHLSNLRFADDIVLLVDFQTMFSVLNYAAKTHGLQINASKAKIVQFSQ